MATRMRGWKTTTSSPEWQRTSSAAPNRRRASTSRQPHGPPSPQPRRRVPRLMIPATFSLLLAVGTVLYDRSNSSADSSSFPRRLLRAIIDRGNDCNTLPTLHDSNSAYEEDYNKLMSDFLKGVNGDAYDTVEDFDELPRNVDGEWTREPKDVNEARFYVFNQIDEETANDIGNGKPKFMLRDDEFEGFPRASAWKEISDSEVEIDSSNPSNVNKQAATPTSPAIVHVPADSPLSNHKRIWKIPQDYEIARSPADMTVAGNCITYVSWFSGNFGHFLHDHLPVIAWLRENVDPDTKFLLLDHPKHREILEVVDSKFVRERVVWVSRDTVLQVEGGTLTVAATSLPYRNLRPVESLGRWLKESTVENQNIQPQQTIIYYTRGGSTDTEHGRIVEPHHENDILETIRRSMVAHHRSEKLVVFNGQDLEGNTMSVQQQFELFRSASAVIGPHGSGLANIVWMDPSATPPTSTSQVQAAMCKRKPKIVEFLLGPDSAQVHPPCETCKGLPFTRTYYHLYSTIPWMDYHHVLYAPNSTEARTFVDLGALEEGLDAIWGEEDTVMEARIEGRKKVEKKDTLKLASDNSDFIEVLLHLSRVDAPIVNLVDPASSSLSTLSTTTTSTSSSETPLFFHVPRAGTSIKYILGGCLNLRMATNYGGDQANADAELKIITAPEGGSYINVNTATIPGIERAAQRNLIPSRFAHVVVTPHLHPAATQLFDSDHRARMFTMLRHPVERAMSTYHHLQTATWESTYDPAIGFMGIADFAKSDLVESDWMVRFLTGEMEGTLTDWHLQVAKQILGEYCLVGIMDEKEESLRRFEAYFGWHDGDKDDTDQIKARQECRDHLLSDNDKDDGGRHTTSTEMKVVEKHYSEAYQVLRDKNALDIELYEYALRVFEDQAALFQKRGVHHKNY